MKFLNRNNIRANPKNKPYVLTKEYIDRKKNLKKLADNFEDFISLNEIFTITNIPFNKFSDLINDIESIYVEFIRNGREIYVVLTRPEIMGFEKIPYKRKSTNNTEDAINLLVCVIKGNYCYFPTTLSFDHEFGHAGTQKQFQTTKQIFPTGFGEYDIDEITYGDPVTYEVFTYSFDDQFPYWMYIFNDADYANILAVVKDKFILNFMDKIAIFKIQFVKKKDYNFVWSVLSDKFRAFRR